MNIKKFLHLSSGKWFAQRTSYQLVESKAESCKADVTIELISAEAPQVIELCRQAQIDPNLSIGGARYSWDNSVDWGKPKQRGSVLMVLVPEGNESQAGKFLQVENSNQVKSGRYLLGEDKALTLMLERDGIYAQERQWFASDNLRLRTTWLRNTDGTIHTAFYSEIRRAAPKSQTLAEDAAVNS